MVMFTGTPQAVTLSGYPSGMSAEEPFITADGQYMIFDDRMDANPNANIHYAKRVSNAVWTYKGLVNGTNTGAFEAISGIDDANNIFFMSTRAYNTPNYNAAYKGKWASPGNVTGAALLPALGSNQAGVLKGIDNVSPDGAVLYLVTLDSTVTPNTVRFGVAWKNPDGTYTGELDPATDPRAAQIKALFAAVYDNPPPDTLTGAPFISRDFLEAYFTRNSSVSATANILVSTRPNTSVPFEAPVVITAADGFVEGQFLSSDGKSLYYHKAVPLSPGVVGFKIYMLSR